jgi:3-hydroxyacyl-CoA dehydrogenase
VTHRFDPDWLVPEWNAPGVGAVMTTRAGGVSAAPFDSLNLREGLGDEKYAPCPLLVEHVAAGRLGRKSGEGFYRY